MGKRLTLFIILSLLLPLTMASAQSFGFQSVEAGVTTTIPLGDYRELSELGLGVNTQARFGFSPQTGLQVIGDLTAVYNFTTESGTAIWDIAPAAAVGYVLPLGETFVWGGQAGWGLMIHQVTGEWDSGVSGPETYSDQFLYVGAELGWVLHERGTLYLRPRYAWFSEEENSGHTISADIGYRFVTGGEE